MVGWRRLSRRWLQWKWGSIYGCVRGGVLVLVMGVLDYFLEAQMHGREIPSPATPTKSGEISPPAALTRGRIFNAGEEAILVPAPARERWPASGACADLGRGGNR